MATIVLAFLDGCVGAALLWCAFSVIVMLPKWQREADEKAQLTRERQASEEFLVIGPMGKHKVAGRLRHMPDGLRFETAEGGVIEFFANGAWWHVIKIGGEGRA